MASLADILRLKHGMVWDTPAGATSLPGYGGFAQQQAAPQPQVDPSQFMPSTGIPQGYAELFQPQQQPQGMLSMITGRPDAPIGGMPQGLMDMLAGSSGSASVGAGGSGAFQMSNPNEAPVPRSMPVKPDTYTVRKGDTLTSIAKRLGTTVKALAAKNGIKNANRIKAGATLQL